MQVLSIANKNIKEIFKNIYLLLFLIAVPLMQIYIINIVSEKASTDMSSLPEGAFTKIVLLGGNIESISLTQKFASGILVQFLLLTAMIAASTIVSERENKTLIRLFVAPLSKLKLLIGILLGHSVVVLFVTSAIILLTKIVFKINWGNSLINLVAVILICVYVTAALAFLISVIFKSAKLAGGIMSVVVVIMTFLSGSFNPQAEPSTLSNFTINKWMADSFLAIMEGKGLNSIFINIAVLIGIGTLFLILSSMIYRKENIYE